MDNETKALLTTLAIVIILVAVIALLYTLRARKKAKSRLEKNKINTS